MRSIASLFIISLCSIASIASAGEKFEQCDPTKTIGSESCAKCHAPETAIWKTTPHFRTFEQLHRTPQAKEIAQRMGIASIKRSEVCTQCHYTMQKDGATEKAISGVSCESCHGAARDWLALHNDFGGPNALKQAESPEHRAARRSGSIAAGMRNPNNPFLIARSCHGCHTVPNEKLVNTGGHVTGTKGFEFVAWSQGKIKHTFIDNSGKNAPNTKERLRVMYLCGLVADLEFSTRATAIATVKAGYGVTSANRAASAAVKLAAIQEKLSHPLLEEILRSFANVELRTKNAAQLNAAADEIRSFGERLGSEVRGEDLAALDAELPAPNTYK